MDLRDVYCCVPLKKQWRKYVRFKWEGSLYRFLCMCFRLSPAPVSVLCKLYIRTTAYLDDPLILGKILEVTIISRDTVVYLLQNLGFVVNLKKSVVHPTQRIKFFEMIIGSVEMAVSLPQEKVESISNFYFQCRRCQ